MRKENLVQNSSPYILLRIVEQAHSIFYILQQYSNLTKYSGEGRGLVRLVELFLDRRGRWERTRDVIIINPERGCIYTILVT